MPNEPKANENQPAALNPVARRNARRYCLQAMYVRSMSGTSIPDIEHEFIHHHIKKVFDIDYFKALLYGIAAHQAEVDQEINAVIERTLEELDRVEYAVLQVATYELLMRPDVPYRVIINEALELTKKYGSIEGYKFVNGVLDKIAKKKRILEIASDNKL